MCDSESHLILEIKKIIKLAINLDRAGLILERLQSAHAQGSAQAPSDFSSVLSSWDFCCSAYHFFNPVVRTREFSHLEIVVLFKCLLFVWMAISEMRSYQLCSSVLTLTGSPQQPHLLLLWCACWQTVRCLLVKIPSIPKTFVSSLLVPLPAFCQADELECANHECVSRDRWCDGEADCVDSSDEWDCGELLASAICSDAWQPFKLNEP